MAMNLSSSRVGVGVGVDSWHLDLDPIQHVVLSSAFWMLPPPACFRSECQSLSGNVPAKTLTSIPRTQHATKRQNNTTMAQNDVSGYYRDQIPQWHAHGLNLGHDFTGWYNDYYHHRQQE